MVAFKYYTIFALVAASSAAPVNSAPKLEARQGFSIPGIGGSDTANDVTSGTCKPVTYIFARGTTETGNMGSTVGPALKEKLESALGADQVATQGVNYPADIAGTFVGSVSPGQAQGSQNCAQLVKQAISKCPDTKIVLAGYSQGAQQVHGCLIDLSTDEAAKVAVSCKPSARKAFPLAQNTEVLRRLLSLSVTLSRPSLSATSTNLRPRFFAPLEISYAPTSLSSHLPICRTPLHLLVLRHSSFRASLVAPRLLPVPLLQAILLAAPLPPAAPALRPTAPLLDLV